MIHQHTNCLWTTLASFVPILALAALGCDARGDSETVATAQAALVPALVSPSGAEASTSVTFTWNPAVESPTANYWIWLTDGSVFTATATQAGCVSGTNCSATFTVNPGSHDWYIMQNGEPWAGPLHFTVAGVTVPPAPTALNPTGVASTSQTFSWLAGGSDATDWRIWTTEGLLLTFTASALNCASGGTCTTPAQTLGAGTSAGWYVSGLNATGWGPWAGPATYTVSGTPVPPAATSLGPVGAASTSQSFVWLAGGADATAWQIWTTDGTTASFNASDINCAGGGTCSTPPVVLNAGTMDWYVRGENTSGWGPWAGPTTITATAPVPPAPTGLSPVGPASTSQQFSWVAGGTDATDWQIWMTTGVVFTYTAAQLNCAAGGLCTTPLETLQPGTTDWYVRGMNSTGWADWTGPATITVAP